MTIARCAFLLSIVIALGGCAAPAPTPSPTPGPTAAELTAMVPESVGDFRLIKSSRTTDIGSGQPADPQSAAFLADLDIEEGEIVAVEAYGFSPGREDAVSVGAWYISGVDGEEAMGAIRRALGRSEQGYTLSPATLAGKEGLGAVALDTPESQAFMYTANDVVFLVIGSNRTLVIRALEQMP